MKTTTLPEPDAAWMRAIVDDPEVLAEGLAAFQKINGPLAQK